MAEQTPGLGAGTLSGINLSGDDQAPDAALPPEDDRTLGEAAADVTLEAPSEPVAAVDAPAPPDTETASDGAGDGGKDTPPAPPATADPEAKVKKKTGAPARPYVVLKEETFDDGGTYTVKVHEVTARNAQNAMRQAFKDLSAASDGTTEATLVVIPASMYRPTLVKLNKTERVSVSFG